jgi:cyclopropane fatty-acyl-phospholipid synthase-like methyltransferase
MTQETGLVKYVLDAQWRHWEQTFAERPEMFGEAPSEAARKAAELFTHEGVRTILELGGGQGRDTLFFAHQGFHVSVLDYGMSADCVHGFERFNLQNVEEQQCGASRSLSLH